MTHKTQVRASSASATFLFLLAGILVLVNVLGLFFHLRADTTKKELFSLSKGSQHLASSLKDRMEIIGYFSPDLPPPHNATERYVRDLLMEYRNASNGKISVRFVHPTKDDEKQEAERDGVQRVQDQKLESDSFSVHEGYRGIAFHYLGDTKAIPAIDDTDGLEYSITQIIKEMAGEKVKIGVLAGKNAEPPPNPMMGMRQPQGGLKLNSIKAYLPTYDVQEVKADKEIPTDLKALLIVQPDEAFTDNELRYIDQYVMRGGSLAVFGAGTKIDLTMGTPTATFVDTGLNKLLDKWGVDIQTKIVADAQCGRARLPTNIGIPIAVPYPPVPIVTFEDYQMKHPVLFRLDQVPLPYAEPLALNDALKGDKDVKRTILAQSTKYSWLMEGTSVDLKARERWEPPSSRKSYVLGVALQGTLPSAFAAVPASTPEGGDSGAAPTNIKAPAKSEKPVHVLVFGSGYFMRDEFLPQPQGADTRQVPSAAVAFALNAVDWLAQDSDLIEIRAKSVEDPTLEVPTNVKEAEATIRQAISEQDQEKADKAFKQRKVSMAAWDQKKISYRWGNTLGLPLAFALFGVVRWRVRKAKRANLKL